jgi:hypothetical protein
MKPMLKSPGIKHLKRKYDIPLSSFAFKFNLRRYTMVIETGGEDLIVKPVARASLRALVERTKVQAAVGFRV